MGGTTKSFRFFSKEISTLVETIYADRSQASPCIYDWPRLFGRSKDFAYTVAIRTGKKTEVDRETQMKITDNGFSERIATPGARTQQTAETGRGSSSNGLSRAAGGSSDTLQLSNIASQLSSGYSDASRASRLSSIAQAVKSNSFQVDPMQISKAMVAEAVSGSAA